MQYLECILDKFQHIYLSLHFYKDFQFEDFILDIYVKLFKTILKQNKKVSINPIRWEAGSILWTPILSKITKAKSRPPTIGWN